jgi:UDP-GlcNAc3NAcA epimerase
VLHTGQHYDFDLSEVFFRELGLGEPRYRLDLHTADVETMRPGIADAVARERPDWVLVYGDTNSTLAGAEAAGDIPVAHVEAGLRSFDLSMPEERNRIAVDGIAALLLCPDERSARQLASEGVHGLAEIVGDVMADASRLFAPIARERSEILELSGLMPHEFVLVTIHREANVEPRRLQRIVDGLNRLGETIVFPAHPRTRAVLEELGGRRPFEVSDPLGYLDMTALASQARVIVTDSGGLQKEAYWYGVPCLTVRPSTEWVDTVAAGANRLVEPEEIEEAVAEASFPSGAPPLYGDGHASEKIAAALYASGP